MNKDNPQPRHIPLLNRHVSGLALARNFIASRYLRSVATAHRAERGVRMACFANEEIGIELNLHGVYERPHMDALRALIGRLAIDTSGLAFCDIGANIGNHSVYLSGFFKKTYAFEPNPDVYYLLQFNLSKIASAETFNIGLGECAAELDLYQDDANLGASSSKPKAGASLITKVPIRKFDDVYPDDIPIGLVKIDVEGMEYRVLSGARAMIAKYRPLIAFEQHMEDIVNEEYSAIRLLEEMGYAVCWLDFSSAKHRSGIMRAMVRLSELILGRTTRISLVAHSAIPRASHTLLVAVPSERLKNPSL